MQRDDAGRRATRNPPDVTVIVPVFNTRPYLRRCLMSLVEQSIGRERMEIIAVDDGSTDGGGAELDRLAARHRDILTVLHQPNSGGPASPCNRGLERARGRYVFFVGSDDHLGREALQRLVAAADEQDADVVLGRVVGVNGRTVYQEVFAHSRVDIGLADSALPWSLANTKLFRRDLIERYGLRFCEDMPVLSDQPFTIEACFRARRISVLADYDYYYAVRRLDARNITYSSRRDVRLRCIESLMTFVAKVVDVQEQRDAVLTRHFALELAALLGDDFLGLDRAEQERMHAGVGEVVRQHLTDTVADRLPVDARVRLRLAGEGTLDDLLAVLGQDARQGVPPAVVRDGRWYAGYPGTAGYRPGSWRDVTAVRSDWLAKLDATGVAWDADGRHTLTVTARGPLAHRDEAGGGSLHLAAGGIDGTTVHTAAGETQLTVRVRFELDRLLAGGGSAGRRLVIRAHLAGAGGAGSAVLRSPWPIRGRPRVCRQGTRLYVVRPTRDHRGQVAVSVVPVTARRVLAKVTDRLRRPVR